MCCVAAGGIGDRAAFSNLTRPTLKAHVSSQTYCGQGDSS
jgi:hypothetical protein